MSCSSLCKNISYDFVVLKSKQRTSPSQMSDWGSVRRFHSALKEVRNGGINSIYFVNPMRTVPPPIVHHGHLDTISFGTFEKCCTYHISGVFNMTTILAMQYSIHVIYFIHTPRCYFIVWVDALTFTTCHLVVGKQAFLVVHHSSIR